MTQHWRGEKPSRGEAAGHDRRRGRRDVAVDQSCDETERWNPRPDTDRWLAQSQLGHADLDIPFRIQGWLAERGTSVWFGAGSTGKTQLMLWMAAMIASRPGDRLTDEWLGGRINGTGHVLVLTAEDTREQIMARLRDVVVNTLLQDDAARQRTLSRIHVMPFLSMTEDEFRYPNPSLLEIDEERTWGPTGVMKKVRGYIEEWNRLHVDDDDRIVGVIMDSATSMAGFDSLDAQATTNFFFYLGRLCETLAMFWAVIGHTPKVTSIPYENHRATATSRLRGVAMWTTAPRMTVEIRLVQDWKVKGRRKPEKEKLREWLGDRVERTDILVAYVAKANLKDAYAGERVLVRRRRGAFLDVTNQPEEVLPVLDMEKAERDRTHGAEGGIEETATIDQIGAMDEAASPKPKSAKKVRGRPRKDPAFFDLGTRLVFETIQAYCLERDGRLSASALLRMIAEQSADDARRSLVRTASGGNEREARPGAINWHLDRLAASGILAKVGRFYYLAGDPLDADWVPA